MSVVLVLAVVIEAGLLVAHLLYRRRNRLRQAEREVQLAVLQAVHDIDLLRQQSLREMTTEVAHHRRIDWSAPQP